MRVVHFSGRDTDGANKAAYQIHASLIRAGVDSVMLVGRKETSDKRVVEVSNLWVKLKYGLGKKRSLGALIYWLDQEYRKRILNEIPLPFSFNWNQSGVDVELIKKYLVDVDLVFLHWIDGFLSSKDIQKIHQTTQAPIVWTLMDLEPLTGGYHYETDVKEWLKCADKVMVRRFKKILNENIKYKKRHLAGLPINWVAPTEWLYQKVRGNNLFEKRMAIKILLAVDTKKYRPMNKQRCRRRMKMKNDDLVIFFGARNLSERRKGAKEINEVLLRLEKLVRKRADLAKNILLVSAGDKLKLATQKFRHKHLGAVDERVLATVYNACDVFWCPSIEDGGPMMVNEAVACGARVVMYDMGVARDLMDKKDKRVSVPLGKQKKMAQELMMMLETKNDRRRNIDPRLKPERQAQEYIKLLRKLIREKNEE